MTRKTIRHRLIEAMGGYTDRMPEIIQKQPKFVFKEREICKISASADVTRNEVATFGKEGAEQFIRSRLVYDLARSLNDERFMELERVPSSGEMAYRLVASLYVADRHEGE